MKGKLIFTLLTALGIMTHAQQSKPIEAVLIPHGHSDVSSPSLLFDGDPNTPWKPAPQAHGLGARFELRFDTPVMLDSVFGDAFGEDAKQIEVTVDQKALGYLSPDEGLSIGMKVSRILFRITDMDPMRAEIVMAQNRFAELLELIYPTPDLSLGEIRLYAQGNPKPSPVTLRKSIPGLVLASSVEEPATHVHPVFLFDGRHDFGWATDHGRQGVGESIAIRFDTVVRIEQIRFIDGPSSTVPSQPILIKKLTVATSDAKPKMAPVETGAVWKGSFLDMAAGRDDLQYGTAIFKPGVWKYTQGSLGLQGSQFVIGIQEVMEGSKDKVLHIQEMEFYDGKSWFRLQPDQEREQGTFVRAKTKGMPIGNILDQTFTFQNRELDDPLEATLGNGLVSFCFQTDGGFYFNSEALEDAPGTWSMQGRWEHLPAAAGQSKVHIEGMLNPVRANQMRAVPKPIDVICTLDDQGIFCAELGINTQFEATESSLVPCQTVPDVKLDLRYKTPDNFLKEPLYPACMPCLMRLDTRDQLVNASNALHAIRPDLNFLIYDAYRPLSVQHKMWAQMPDTNYVADPNNGGSSHNKGAALDLTLTADGVTSIPMPTAFDHFGKEAHHDYKKLSKEIKANRQLLRSVMEGAGFKALETEWWHYKWPGDFPIIAEEVDCQ